MLTFDPLYGGGGKAALLN